MVLPGVLGILPERGETCGDAAVACSSKYHRAFRRFAGKNEQEETANDQAGERSGSRLADRVHSRPVVVDSEAGTLPTLGVEGREAPARSNGEVLDALDLVAGSILDSGRHVQI
jgi:hypothetical protein